MKKILPFFVFILILSCLTACKKDDDPIDGISSLLLQVENQDGKALSDASIQIYDTNVSYELDIENYAPLFEFKSDESGLIAVEQILEGAYIAYVSYVVDGKEYASLKQIRVISGQINELTITLNTTDVPSLILHVEDQEGNAISNVTVQIFDNFSNYYSDYSVPLFQYTTDETGVINVDYLQKGYYTAYTTYMINGREYNSLKQIQVIDNQTIELSLVLEIEAQIGDLIIHLTNSKDKLIDTDYINPELKIDFGLAPSNNDNEEYRHLSLEEIWEQIVYKASAQEGVVNFEDLPAGQYYIYKNINGITENVGNIYIYPSEEEIFHTRIQRKNLPFVGSWKFQSAVNDNDVEVPFPINKLDINSSGNLVITFDDNTNTSSYIDSGHPNNDKNILVSDFYIYKDGNYFYFDSYYYKLPDFSTFTDLNNPVYVNYDSKTLSFKVYDNTNGNYIVTFKRDDQ
ncbi:hypothetical protein [Xanthovirga aplysinae]|uniref:hypothetical protein n=1 Tax=Xanthovirga aplysinae TaxID=2529853 RepID=UPI0012BD72FF|nr:hypothetical protein [Xanthovirga aplysinae]MTI30413.1 hypothetical protein [Xanthovirga aplysinae]